MVRVVAGAVQHYGWGDPTLIPDLFGITPDGRPWAEMWFGTHPSAPATLEVPSGIPLETLTGPMSMLVKILACSSPLSLQTHPTLAQAAAGFDREEARGIPRSDAMRLYRDRSDKPEMIVALTPFEALCGFAPIVDSLEFLDDMGWSGESAVLRSRGIEGYLRWAFDQSTPPDMAASPEWLRTIADVYPHDAGLRVAAVLNHVLLSPGEALALPAGNLHAYLHGAGLEVMKSSDNVVRAGFTTKAIDVGELLGIVDTSPLVDPIARPTAHGPWLRFPSPTDAFDVANWSWSGGDAFAADPRIRIVIGTTGLIDSQRACTAVVVMPGETLTPIVGPDGADSGSWWVCSQN